MGVEGCTKCIKYMLFVFNFIFWLAGGVILGVALWLRHDPQTTGILYLEMDDKQAPNTFFTDASFRHVLIRSGLIIGLIIGEYGSVAGGQLQSLTETARQGIYILIAVGAVMMFVGFLGCYGAIQESQCLLGTFFTCLVILFACEVAAGIWGFVNKDKIAKDVQQFYSEAYQQVRLGSEKSREKARAVLKVFHETLHCCGTDVITNIGDLIIDDICPKDTMTIIGQDCNKKIDELFSGKLYLIGIAAIIVAVIMIFEMILSMVLCCGIRNSSVY